MRVYYIQPKKQKKNIVLYESSIASLLSFFMTCSDPELLFILSLCLVLAIVAAGQQVYVSRKKRETEKWDKMLYEHERKKKIKRMFEEIEEENKSPKCTNVDTTKLV